MGRGRDHARELIDQVEAARDLARLVAALQRVDPTGAPRGRGISLRERDDEIRYWLARYQGDPVVRGECGARSRRAVEGSSRRHHGDLDVRDWLVRGGRITGVIDWASMGIGDPACDVMVA